MTFTTGMTGSFTVTATGMPVPTVTETGTLPSGVTFNSLNASAGRNAGSGEPPGSYPLTFTAHNGVGSDAAQNFTLTVSQASQGGATLTKISSGTFNSNKCVVLLPGAVLQGHGIVVATVEVGRDTTGQRCDGFRWQCLRNIIDAHASDTSDHVTVNSIESAYMECRDGVRRHHYGDRNAGAGGGCTAYDRVFVCFVRLAGSRDRA